MTLALAAATLVGAVSIAAQAVTWWQLITVVILGTATLVLGATGVRALIALRHRDRDPGDDGEQP